MLGAPQYANVCLTADVVEFVSSWSYLLNVARRTILDLQKRETSVLQESSAAAWNLQTSQGLVFKSCALEFSHAKGKDVVDRKSLTRREIHIHCHRNLKRKK